MGGYGATPHRHEASRRVRQPLHHEPVLPVAAPMPAGESAELEKALEAVKTPADSAKLPFFARAQLASARPRGRPIRRTRRSISICRRRTAWCSRMCSPNGQRTAPLAFIDQYIGNLRQYRAIAIDVGDQDGLRVDASKLHDVLDKYGIANTFEIYHGTHTSAVADRFQNHVMPFFSENLCFQAGCR